MSKFYGALTFIECAKSMGRISRTQAGLSSWIMAEQSLDDEKGFEAGYGPNAASSMYNSALYAIVG